MTRSIILIKFINRQKVQNVISSNEPENSVNDDDTFVRVFG